MKTLTILIVFAVVCAGGCATTSTHAKVIDVNGVSQELKQVDITPPFAKKAEAVGKMHTRKGADGTYELETGQSATGIDNTAQGAVIQALVGAILQAYTAGLQVRPAPKPPILEEIPPALIPKTLKVPKAGGGDGG